MKVPEYRIVEKFVDGYSRFYPQFRRFWIWWTIYDGLFQTSLSEAERCIANHRKCFVSRLVPDKIYRIAPEDQILVTLQEMDGMCERAKSLPK